MPGFWDYFQKMAQQSNEKLNNLYERQFNLANMMSQQSQNQMSNMLNLGQLKSANLGKQIDIMDASMNRGLQREKMAQDLQISNDTNQISRERMGLDKILQANDQSFRREMILLSNQLENDQIDKKEANQKAAEARAKKIDADERASIQYEGGTPTKWNKFVHGGWGERSQRADAQFVDITSKVKSPLSRKYSTIEWYKDGSFYKLRDTEDPVGEVYDVSW